MTVDVLDKDLIDVAHHVGQANDLGWRDEEMNVVCHQDVGVHYAGVSLRELLEQPQVQDVVRIRAKHLTPVMTPLEDMDGISRQQHSAWRSGHVQVNAGQRKALTRESGPGPGQAQVWPGPGPGFSFSGAPKTATNTPPPAASACRRRRRGG